MLQMCCMIWGQYLACQGFGQIDSVAGAPCDATALATAWLTIKYIQ